MLLMNEQLKMDDWHDIVFVFSYLCVCCEIIVKWPQNMLLPAWEANHTGVWRFSNGSSFENLWAAKLCLSLMIDTKFLTFIIKNILTRLRLLCTFSIKIRFAIIKAYQSQPRRSENAPKRFTIRNPRIWK